ncbi:MAG: hypothetical protein GY906_10700 [bacterium]|nr:hypothetical protein [bacterium]
MKLRWMALTKTTAAVILLCGAVAAGLSLRAEATAEDPSRGEISWHEVELRANKFFVSATSKLSVTEGLSAAEVDIVADVPEGEPVAQVGEKLTKVVVESRLPFGKREHAEVWIDEESNAVLQIEKLVTGRSPYWKRFRSIHAGYFIWRAAPGENQNGLNPDEWTRRSEKSEILSGYPDGEVATTDTYALIYRLVQAAGIPPTQPEETILTAGKTGWFRVSMTDQGIQERRANFTRTVGDVQEQVEGQVKVKAFTLHAEPVGGEEQKQDLELLGLRDNITLYLDITSGLPIELEGHAKSIGRVRMRLRSAVMREDYQETQDE